MTFPIQIRATDAVRELLELTQEATQNLSQFRDDDIQIGTTPKEAVYLEDNLVLVEKQFSQKKGYEAD